MHPHHQPSDLPPSLACRENDENQCGQKRRDHEGEKGTHMLEEKWAQKAEDATANCFGILALAQQVLTVL